MAVSPLTRQSLWTRSAGRCEFDGCNRPLLGDLLTGKDELNDGYVAHIVADSPGGPRGDRVRSPVLADDIANLMLLCNGHHRLIDALKTRAEYPEERLLAMKVRHEARIELVTGIDPDRSSHVLLYAANVGEHSCPSRFDLAKLAMLPARFPAERTAIQIELSGCDFQDHEPEYWDVQIGNLRRHYERKVRTLVADGHIKHLSVFAVAPQPLLIELGRLLCDLPGIEVHQLHREPQGWDWREARSPIEYAISNNAVPGKQVGLILGLSDKIVDARAHQILGLNAPVWRIEAVRPGKDIMHRREDLEAFRDAMRSTYGAIKAAHGQDATIHVFPCLPVSAAIEVGRTWMPKADLPLVIYDELRGQGGFKPRLNFNNPAGKPGEEIPNA